MVNNEPDNTVEPADLPYLDWVLQLLVETATAGGMNYPVTLNIGGGLVSGYIVGAEEYFDGVGEELASAVPNNPEIADEFRSAFSEIKGMWNQAQSDGTPRAPGFIHLKDAKIHYPGARSIPEDRGVWWRGRLSEISGFCLGTVGSREA